jgi:hypothetical protein
MYCKLLFNFVNYILLLLCYVILLLGLCIPIVNIISFFLIVPFCVLFVCALQIRKRLLTHFQ